MATIIQRNQEVFPRTPAVTASGGLALWIDNQPI